MKRSAILTFAFASLCLCSGAGAEIVTFQIPGIDYIWPKAMNGNGQVVGVYADNNGGTHGFLAQPDGALTRFDVPVTGTSNRQGYGVTTAPSGITESGVVIGSYFTQESSGGFVRAVDGSISLFGSGFGPNGSATPAGVNKKGWSVGDISTRTPFLRDPSGAIQEFKVSHAPGGAWPMVVNRSRTIAGWAVVHTAPYLYQAFIRPAHGTAVLFGDPHTTSVDVTGINDAGTVVGSFVDASDPHRVSFVRTADGTLTTFVAPNGATDTHARGINKSGMIVGDFTDSNKVTHGFIRAADGTFAPFDVAGSSFTEILAVNDEGAITGDALQDGVRIGFAGKP